MTPHRERAEALLRGLNYRYPSNDPLISAIARALDEAVAAVQAQYEQSNRALLLAVSLLNSAYVKSAFGIASAHGFTASPVEDEMVKNTWKAIDAALAAASARKEGT